MIDPAPYMGLVKAIAGKVKKRSPRKIGYEDLVGYGMVGLMEACNRFDPSKGHKFITFAFHRIRGAMLDHLRREMEYDRHETAVAEVFDRPIEEEEDYTEELEALREVLKTIPKRERDLLLAESGQHGRTHQAYGISRSWSFRVRANARRHIAAKMKGNIS